VNPYQHPQIHPRQLDFNDESVQEKQHAPSEESRREVKINLNPDQCGNQNESKIEVPPKKESI
jgi:hypothetical protein